MPWLSIFNEPENKTIAFTIPRPVYHAIKTYAYMEQIETNEAIEQAIIYFLKKKLFIKKDKPEIELKEVIPGHLYTRQLK